MHAVVWNLSDPQTARRTAVCAHTLLCECAVTMPDCARDVLPVPVRLAQRSQKSGILNTGQLARKLLVHRKSPLEGRGAAMDDMR